MFGAAMGFPRDDVFQPKSPALLWRGPGSTMVRIWPIALQVLGRLARLCSGTRTYSTDGPVQARPVPTHVRPPGAVTAIAPAPAVAESALLDSLSCPVEGVACEADDAERDPDR